MCSACISSHTLSENNQIQRFDREGQLELHSPIHVITMSNTPCGCDVNPYHVRSWSWLCIYIKFAYIYIYIPSDKRTYIYFHINKYVHAYLCIYRYIHIFKAKYIFIHPHCCVPILVEASPPFPARCRHGSPANALVGLPTGAATSTAASSGGGSAGTTQEKSFQPCLGTPKGVVG